MMTEPRARLCTLRHWLLAALWGAVLAVGARPALAADLRDWTSGDGRSMKAALVSFDGREVRLRRSDGSEATVAISLLSLQDQAFVRAQAANGGSTPPKWPAEVMVSSDSIEVKMVAADAERRRFVYHSAAFEYVSQGKLLPGLMKEVARTFEATRQLVGALPWGIVCQPPDGAEFYHAALFETRKDYVQAGGPANSGGVYMTGEKIFKIPFESLGIKHLGNSYTKDDNYSSDTLVHEITHQMMHDYLPYLPQWAVEGCAEYTEMLPFKAGRFAVARHKEGLKDYLERWRKRGKEPRLPDVAQLFHMTRPAWDQQAQKSSERMGELYQQSALLVYFFNHLDGDGTGTAWAKFMEATRGEMLQWQDYERHFKAYRLALDEFFKLPGVKKLENDRFSYPSNLTPPRPPEPPDGKDRDDQTPLKHLDVLLRERGELELQRDIAAKFKAISVKLNL